MFILKLYGANPNFKLQARKKVLKMKVQEKVAHLKLASEHLVFVQHNNHAYHWKAETLEIILGARRALFYKFYMVF